jgi:hypothetical protein
VKHFIALLFSVSLYAQTAAFPSAIAGDINLKIQANGVQTSLLSSITSTSTTASVVSCNGIPYNFLATIDNEIVAGAYCVGNVITFSTLAGGCNGATGRGCDGTAAASHIYGAPVSLYADAWHHNALRVEVEAIETALGVNLGNVLKNPVTLPISATVTSGSPGITVSNSFTGSSGGAAIVASSKGNIIPTLQVTQTGSAAAIIVSSSAGDGIDVASSSGGYGINATTTTTAPAIYVADTGGNSTSAVSVTTSNGGGNALLATNTSFGTALAGTSSGSGGYGVYGTANGGTAVYGTSLSASGYSGSFSGGKFQVTGTITGTNMVTITNSGGSGAIITGTNTAVSGVTTLNGNAITASMGGTAGHAFSGSQTTSVGTATALFSNSGTDTALYAVTTGTTPATFLGSGGTCSIVPTTSSLSCTSDITMKKEGAVIDNGLDKVLKLKPVTFVWKNAPNDGRHEGFYAQDVQRVIPSLVNKGDDGHLMLSYTGIIPYLVSAIQQQEKEIKALRARIK